MGLFTKITYTDVSYATRASQPLTLFQLQNKIREALEEAFPAGYWVVAEISEVRTHASGHCYLTLTEKDNRNQNNLIAQAKGTIWRNNYREISTYFESQTGHKLRSGLKILLNASVRFHELYGFNLDILDIDPNYTIGDLARQKQETLRKLQANGLLEKNKQRFLPEVPQRVAVISSATAAGFEDFMKQLAQNPYGYHFQTTLFEASMQGNEAAASVRQALRLIEMQQSQFDAVILIRGGGAQTDLLCFDDYELAATIGNFSLPVLTGIGHERDETVADIVAHTKLKTPTAVAAFLIDCCLTFEAHLDTVFEDLKDLAAVIVKRKNAQLENQVLQLSQQTNRYLKQQDSRLEMLVRSLSVKPKKYLTEQDKLISCHELNLVNFTRKKLENSEVKLLQQSHKLENISRQTVAQKQQKLEHLIYCISTSAKNNISNKQLLFQPFTNKIKAETQQFLREKTYRLQLTEMEVKNRDPEQMLLRGYTLTYVHGQLVRSAKDLKPGDLIQTHFADGGAESTITNLTIL
ncbi:exodeoxyribonuclease VII large subunit [Adhaeribacter sp. BT258]|uniref:Exodeoxyribonuclease 7 large subunit n=1 Tax=Adhaeribacter terrigena TaxID=2793070 RepID=A0ABS1C3T1_9BACT|nr:exodeoxyribonuclease VII large subunit [Adhaeribacter terrigena]MBK0404024.1 exodeoxyribonuclease VII large subunit [Adhaeribacter terrigena]